ncbi:MAG: DHH family phosphoesterase [Candidatus Hadarchaeia archaeon]
MSELTELLKRKGEKGRNILVTAHPHADPDAVGSVLALADLLEYLGAEVAVGIPQGLSKVTRNVLDYLDMEITLDPEVEAECVIILDTSSLGQLEELGNRIKDSGAEIIFIDHHRPERRTKDVADVLYTREEATSATELVIGLAEDLEYEFGAKLSELMLTGVISDTGHFKFANGDTFSSVCKLIRWGAKYRRSLEALKTPEDPSRRIALLKAAKRTELYKRHGIWIALSEVGAYESDAASMLVGIGADISVVANEEEDEVRASARSKSGLASETGLHLGKLFSELSEKFSGNGGGHAGAAGMKAEGKWKDIKVEALSGLEIMLSGCEDD